MAEAIIKVRKVLSEIIEIEEKDRVTYEKNVKVARKEIKKVQSGKLLSKAYKPKKIIDSRFTDHET